MLVDGKLSVYSDEEGGYEIFKYSLTSGESVGDLDLVCDPSTKKRGMTVRVEQDSLVMQLKQASWKHFCSSNPHALLLYLRLAIGRLHRVATFVLADFIPLPDFKTILPDVTRGPDKSILEANIAQLGIGTVEFQAGSNIISVGNAPEDIVIIFSGELNPPVTPLSFHSPPLHSLLLPVSLLSLPLPSHPLSPTRSHTLSPRLEIEIVGFLPTLRASSPLTPQPRDLHRRYPISVTWGRMLHPRGEGLLLDAAALAGCLRGDTMPRSKAVFKLPPRPWTDRPGCLHFPHKCSCQHSRASHCQVYHVGLVKALDKGGGGRVCRRW